MLKKLKIVVKVPSREDWSQFNFKQSDRPDTFTIRDAHSNREYVDLCISKLLNKFIFLYGISSSLEMNLINKFILDCLHRIVHIANKQIKLLKYYICN